MNFFFELLRLKFSWSKCLLSDRLDRLGKGSLLAFGRVIGYPFFDGRRRLFHLYFRWTNLSDGYLVPGEDRLCDDVDHFSGRHS